MLPIAANACVRATLNLLQQVLDAQMWWNILRISAQYIGKQLWWQFVLIVIIAASDAVDTAAIAQEWIEWCRLALRARATHSLMLLRRYDLAIVENCLIVVRILVLAHRWIKETRSGATVLLHRRIDGPMLRPYVHILIVVIVIKFVFGVRLVAAQRGK